MTPIMHKAGPPVVDAHDPFTVSTKDSAKNVSNEKLTEKATAKPAEFELSRVRETTKSDSTSTQTRLPAATSTTRQVRPGPVLPLLRRPLLPLPRFVPSRGTL
jgi:hypothetical protein